jgi:hypothetical protein
MSAQDARCRRGSFKTFLGLSAVGALAVAMAGSAALGAHAQEKAEFANTDTRFLEVSRSVPGFGGAFIRDGSLHIWLTQPSSKLRDQAQAALIQSAGSEFDIENVQVHSADYSFDQLYEWHSAIIDVLSIDGVILTDIDDRSNRIRIAVESLEAQASLVEAELSEQGVPRAAVDIVAGSPVRAAPTTPLGGRLSRFWPTAVLVVTLIGFAFTLRRSLSRKRRSKQVVG